MRFCAQDRSILLSHSTHKPDPFLTMRKLTTLSLLFAFVFLLSPQQATAQVEADETTFKIGPRASLDLNDLNDAFGAAFGIGADVRLQIPDIPVQGNGSFDFYFADDPWTVWAVDVNAVYPFNIDNQGFTPYAGGGLGITRWSADVEEDFIGISVSNTDIGLNLVGGAEFETDSGITPFAQLQLTVAGDADRLGLTGGVLFEL